MNEEELIAQRALDNQIREERDIADIQSVMGTEQGRRVIWSMLEQGKVFVTCFAIDPYATAFNEGQRNLALALLQRVMAHCPDLYLKMANEQKESAGD